MNGRLTSAANRLTRLLESILVLLLFGMFSMVVTLVVLRYVFGTTIIGGNEGTVVAFIFTTALGAAVAIYKDEHISIRYFIERLPRHLQGTMAKLRWLLLALINILVAAYAIAWIHRTGSFLMAALGQPQWVAQISVPIGCTISTIYCLARLCGVTDACGSENE